MKRFLSIVEYELEAEDFDSAAPAAADDATAKQVGVDNDKSARLPSSAIVALEVKPASGVGVSGDDEAGARGGDEEAVEGAEGDSDDDEAGSRLVVIDKTRLVPQIDIDNFIGY